MIIKFIGEQTLDQAVANIEKILKNIQKRARIEALPYKIRGLEVGLVFEACGEYKHLTVNHDGIEEIFQVNVKLESDGSVKVAKDNESETFMDEYSRAIAKGEDWSKKEYSEIISEYNSEDLEQLHLVDGGDVVEVLSRHKITDELICQYFKNNILVAEMSVTK